MWREESGKKRDGAPRGEDWRGPGARWTAGYRSRAQGRAAGAWGPWVYAASTGGPGPPTAGGYGVSRKASPGNWIGGWMDRLGGPTWMDDAAATTVAGAMLAISSRLI